MVQGLFQKIFSRSGKKNAVLDESIDNAESTTLRNFELDSTPDYPINFGYKCQWFAICSENTQAVAEAFELSDIRPANWKTGLNAAYNAIRHPQNNKFVFISPSLNGWVFLIGSTFLYPGRTTDKDCIDFSKHYKKVIETFDEVQFFASYRVVGADTWASAINGRWQRIFTIVDGAILINEGAQSSEEKELGLFDLTGLSEEQAMNAISNYDDNNVLEKEQKIIYPNEEITMHLAGFWSMNPTELEEHSWSPGCGLVGTLPSDHPQQN